MAVRNLGLIAGHSPLTPPTCPPIGPDEDDIPWFNSELTSMLERISVLNSLVFRHDLYFSVKFSTSTVDMLSLLSLDISCQRNRFGRLEHPFELI